MFHSVVAWFCFLTLSCVAVIHAYWAFGGLWPAQSEAELVRTVIGIDDGDIMPSRMMTLIVASLIFAAGCFAAARGILAWDSLVFIRVPLAGLALIFLTRGFLSYMPGPLRDATEPFATLNALYYSPLIVILGAGFALLALSPRQ